MYADAGMNFVNEVFTGVKHCCVLSAMLRYACLHHLRSGTAFCAAIALLAKQQLAHSCTSVYCLVL
jgi:hypothetical protein